MNQMKQLVTFTIEDIMTYYVLLIIISLIKCNKFYRNWVVVCVHMLTKKKSFQLPKTFLK